MARSRYALLLLLATSSSFGCSTFNGNTEILQLDLGQDTVRACELTFEGARHYRNGHAEKAKSVLERAVAADETYGPAHNNLGLLYFDQRDLYEAAWAFQRATEFMPERPEPFNNLGLTFEAAGRLDEAIDMYYSAHELDPTNADYLGNLLRARTIRGDRDESLRMGLGELLFLDKRPEWVAWAEDQLAHRLNQEVPQPESDGTDGARNAPELLPIPLGAEMFDQPVADFVETPSESEIPLSGARIQIRDE